MPCYLNGTTSKLSQKSSVANKFNLGLFLDTITSYYYYLQTQKYGKKNSEYIWT